MSIPIRLQKHAQGFTATRLFAQIMALLLLSVSLSLPTAATPVAKEESSVFESHDEIAPQETRNNDGSGNNIANNDWGAVNSQINRLTSSSFNDNISKMAHPEYENPRIISNQVCVETIATPSPLGLSNMNVLWSEFINNDMQLTTHQDSSHEGGMEEAHIPIPIDDEIMNPGGVEDSRIKYLRTEFISSTGDDEENPREYPNEASSWIDGGSIYSFSVEFQDYLRSGEGGHLKVTDVDGWDMVPGHITEYVESVSGDEPNLQFFIGDSRNLEHIGLTSLQVLFIREHNRIADGLSERNSDWNDEQIFQRTKKIVQAEIQAITYNEYLPSIGINLDYYCDYNSTIKPHLSNEYILLAAFATGSQMADGWLQFDEGLNETAGGHLDLRDGFWTSSSLIEVGGIDTTIRGAAYDTQREMDLPVIPSLRNLMSGAMWGGWMDDCAMDIQRGRDRGITDYNSLREGLGLDRVTNWSDISSDVDSQQKLASAYPDVDSIDAYIGVMAEDRLESSIYGETQQMLVLDQFQRVRDGDRFWYENDAELNSLTSEFNSLRLSDIILRNTEIESIQCDVFFAESDASSFQCHLANSEAPQISGGNEGEISTEISTYIGAVIVLILVAVVVLSGKESENPEENETNEEE